MSRGFQPSGSTSHTVEKWEDGWRTNASMRVITRDREIFGLVKKRPWVISCHGEGGRVNNLLPVSFDGSLKVAMIYSGLWVPKMYSVVVNYPTFFGSDPVLKSLCTAESTRSQNHHVICTWWVWLDIKWHQLVQQNTYIEIPPWCPSGLDAGPWWLAWNSLMSEQARPRKNNDISSSWKLKLHIYICARTAIHSSILVGAI